ncbi:MAG: TRAP transporter small permease subunit [Clostridiales bacterium]|nr:TRAP transporter small permease subunit [Clostridiales bacterium]
MKKFYESICQSFLSKAVRNTYQMAIFLSGLIILLAMVATVVLRYILHFNLFGMDEIILCFVFWFYFFGGVNGSREDSQIRADVVGVIIKNKKIQWGLRLVTRVIELVALAFLIKMSIGLFITNCQRMPSTQGLKIPYIIPQFAIVVGFILMLIYNIGHLIRQAVYGPDDDSQNT